jgi:hypothetical protein
MIFEEIIEKIETVKEGNIHLFFITRHIKIGIKKTSKMLDKYSFRVYQVDIDNTIRNLLNNLTISQLKNLIRKKFELNEYDVISDDTQQLFTYSMINKTMSFNSVMDSLLNSNPPKINSLKELLEKEELWAYCVKFFSENDSLFTFKKVLSGKVAIDEKENDNKNDTQKFIRTIFNTTNAKLELVEGQTIHLDKQIDSIYYNSIFYVIHKGQFEKVIGMEQEFLTKAREVIDDLENTNMIDGLSLVQKQIEDNPSIHKKLVRLSKVGNYRDLDTSKLNQMHKICKKYGDNLKIKDGKLLIEDEKDIDLALKMLADYYKRGEVSGKAYGTFAGKELGNG